MAVNYVNYKGTNYGTVTDTFGNLYYRIYFKDTLVYERQPNILYLDVSGSAIQSAHWLYVDKYASNKSYSLFTVWCTGSGSGASPSRKHAEIRTRSRVNFDESMDSTQLTNKLKGFGTSDIMGLVAHGPRGGGSNYIRGEGGCNTVQFRDNWSNMDIYISGGVPNDYDSYVNNDYYAKFLHWNWSVDARLCGNSWGHGEYYGQTTFKSGNYDVGHYRNGHITSVIKGASKGSYSMDTNFSNNRTIHLWVTQGYGFNWGAS